MVGDALFFHSNLLHTSGPNNSELRRWAFLVAYNTKANSPVEINHTPQYTPLKKVRITLTLARPAHYVGKYAGH